MILFTLLFRVSDSFQIHVCLDEWETGERVTREFEELKYKKIFDRHVANLEAIDAAAESDAKTQPDYDPAHPPPKFTETVGAWLFNDCM